MASYIGDPEATPRKRRGRVNNLPTRSGSSISDASSHQRFSQPASPARSLSPVKDLLNELRFAVPRIDYQASHESAVPATVDTLIQKLAQGLGESCIPIDLKEKLQTSDPMNTRFAHDSIYTRNATPTNTETLWNTVMVIFEEARCCKNYMRDEGAWCSKVVEPLLTLALGGGFGEPIFQWENIQSQAFHTSYLPKTNGFIPISKKADFAWVLSRNHPEVGPFYKKLSFAGKGILLSHLLDAYTQRVAVFSGYEVKKTAGNEDESLAQLAIFLAALLRKMKELRWRALFAVKEARGNAMEGPREQGSTCEPAKGDLLHVTSAHEAQSLDSGGNSITAKQDEGERPGRYRILPVIGWTIHGHQWSTYIAWSSPEDEEDVHIIGPLPMLTMDTSSLVGIFQLIDLLRRVADYGLKVYWPWLKGSIFEPLAA